MEAFDYLQLLAFLAALILLPPLLGRYLARVLSGRPYSWLGGLTRLEKGLMHLTPARKPESRSWKAFVADLIWFNLVGLLLLWLMLQIQAYLPLNPAGIKGMSWHLALNSAISFVTNTNWQSYAGETSVSYLVQMAGLGVQNFVSAATGIAVLLALIRGLSGNQPADPGDFRTDVVRSIVYVLLPLSLILSVFLMGSGVIQNFLPYQEAKTLEGSPQIIPMGPAASQIAIKQLGTNGGGFFNTNSAHPFENPDPLSNFLQMLAILLIPAALSFAYGELCGNKKHGQILFGVMLVLFLGGLVASLVAEFQANPLIGGLVSMEGKESRFGVMNSVLWANATTAASNGSVNSMLDSYSPLSGMVGMVNIMLGEVIFGGVGAGLYGMVIFVILTVFIAGLMVGRTPEYLGKKIQAFEIKMAMIAALAPSAVILVFSALACRFEPGLSGLNNTGPHGLSEILYAFSSAAGNNGSAFAGLNANTPFYNLSLGAGMLIGRFGVIIPVLAIAANLSRKRSTPVSEGTFRTDNWIFAGLLISVILIVGGLTFFPALSLGPIAEHILMNHLISF